MSESNDELLAPREALEQQLAHAEGILACIAEGLIIADSAANVVYWNPAALAMHGFSDMDVLLRQLREFTCIFALFDLDGRELPVVEWPINRALRGEVVSQLELRVRRLDTGAEFVGSYSATSLRDPAGRVVGVALTVRDVTERWRARQELEAIYDSAPIGLCVYDTELRYVRINGRLAEINGLSIAAHLGRSIFEIIPTFAGEVAPILRRVLSTGAPAVDVEVRGSTASQPEVERRWVANYYPLKAPDGHVVGVNVAITEVTERRHAEEELVRSQQERESLLDAERAARAEAERANRLKDEFLATLSHELRTPLNAILGWTQILRSGRAAPDSLPRALEVIERNARVQSELVSDLLDMSRIVSGKLQLERQPVDVRAVAEAALEAVRQSALAKGIGLELQAASSFRPVSGDPARLQQVLWNLLTNAIKFTPSGGRVTLSARQRRETIELRVTDTGQGIDASFLPFLFGRFRQADSSSARQHRGLGLGLSITKQLVELHGGSIRAESPGAGQGATFTVVLPVARGATTAPLSSSDAGAAAGPLLEGLQALVVEDDPDARDLVRRLLEAEGIEVRTASSAAEALQAMGGDVDVIVSDVSMPNEDGYSLIRKIRGLPPERGGAIPAVALTALARVEDRGRALEAGFQRHVSKPVDAIELYAALIQVTGRGART